MTTICRFVFLQYHNAIHLAKRDLVLWDGVVLDLLEAYEDDDA